MRHGPPYASPGASYPVHLGEDFFFLCQNTQTDFLAEFTKFIRNDAELFRTFLHVRDDHHVEHITQDRLADIEDVDIVVKKICGHPGNDAECVLSDYCDYDLIQLYLSASIIQIILH